MNLGLGLVNSEWFVKGAARFVEGATFFLALKALATFSNFFCFCLRLQNQIRSIHTFQCYIILLFQTAQPVRVFSYYGIFPPSVNQFLIPFSCLLQVHASCPALVDTSNRSMILCHVNYDYALCYDSALCCDNAMC